MVCDLLPVPLHFLAHFARTPQLANPASCRPRWAWERKRGPPRAWNRPTGGAGRPVALAMRPLRGWISVSAPSGTHRGAKGDYMGPGEFHKGLPGAIGGGRQKAGSPPDNPTRSHLSRDYGRSGGPMGTPASRQALVHRFVMPARRRAHRGPAARAAPAAPLSASDLVSDIPLGGVHGASSRPNQCSDRLAGLLSNAAHANIALGPPLVHPTRKIQRGRG